MSGESFILLSGLQEFTHSHLLGQEMFVASVIVNKLYKESFSNGMDQMCLLWSQTGVAVSPLTENRICKCTLRILRWTIVKFKVGLPIWQEFPSPNWKLLLLYQVNGFFTINLCKIYVRVYILLMCFLYIHLGRIGIPPKGWTWETKKTHIHFIYIIIRARFFIILCQHNIACF